jgi:hypothetical protein
VQCVDTLNRAKERGEEERVHAVRCGDGVWIYMPPLSRRAERRCHHR